MRPLTDEQTAVLAARAAGYDYKDMSFLHGSPRTLGMFYYQARMAMGAPRYANQANMIMRAFAGGSLLIGEPYTPGEWS